ncbi:MAG: peptidylprolyl isomerase [Planctomycetota bacterium]|nr:peptidylprolyl isomerase [Planctomycetota bacterium]
MKRRMSPLAILTALLFFAPLGLERPAFADELQMTRGGTIVIDGRGADRAWKDALQVSVATVEVPVPGTDDTTTLEPRLRLTESDGRLCLLLEMDEDPGPGMGIVLLVARANEATAADAISIAYRPQSLRQLQYVCRGPAGVGRAAYPAEGAAVWKERGRWSLELGIGLDALRPDDASKPLRIAALTLTRSPNLTAAAPAEAAFTAPAKWPVVKPPEGGWGTGARFDMDALAKEDAADLDRLGAWNAFMTTNAEMRAQPPAGGTEAQVRELLDGLLLTHLDTIRDRRPDLGPRVDVFEADMFRQLGLLDEAATRYERVLKVAPGLREARFGNAFFVELARWTGADPEASPAYAGALARVGKVAQDAESGPYRRDAAAAATGVLLYKQGRFAEAIKRLEPMVRRYPMHRVLAMTLSHAREAVLPWAQEQQRQKRDASANLPRARIVTSRGEIDVELFQDDAPNAVNNFIWLAKKKFFDGLAWHAAVPYLMAQSGDPFSKPPVQEALVGLGGPGYAIRAAPTERLPFRGALAMIQTGAGTAGSQFCVLTGSALHAKDTLMVFGRVIAGQDVADRLVAGDTIVKVEPLRVTEGWDYTPRNVAQEAPTEPKPTAPPSPGRR